jgi:glutamyl-tRNA reductase
MRREAAIEVEAIVDEEFEQLLAQYKRQRADQVISAMYEGAERIKAEELETAFGKLDLDDEERAVVESMADSIVSQLLAPPTDSLRDAAENDDWSTIHTALQLFDPNMSSDESPLGGNSPAEVSPDDIPDHVREQLPAGMLDQLGD